MRKILLIAAAALVLSTPALAAHNACIRQDDIRNWTALTDRSVVLENYRHQKVLLKLIGTCSNLNFRESLEIRSVGSIGLSCVETGDDIVTHGMGLGGRCAIVSVTDYSGPMTWRGHRDDPHDGDSSHHDSH